MKKRTFTLVAAVMLLVVMALAAGCGSSGPSAAVEDFLNAAQDKDCEKMIDYFDLDAPEFQGLEIDREMLVAACEEDAEAGGEVVSYKILEEEVDGSTATVEVEITTKEDGEETTETTTVTVTERDGEWKIGGGF